MMRPQRTLALFLAPVALAGALVACSGGDSATGTPAGPAGDTVSVELRNFAFDPKDLTFKAGQTVQFRLKSKDIEHTFTVKDLGIDWSVRGGRSRTESFAFAAPGKHRVVCTVPGHEGAGMIGALTVTA